METCIITIPSELFATAESSLFEGNFALEQLTAGPDTYTFDKALTYQVMLTNTGGALLVTGTVKGKARTQCVRCLEDVHVEIEGNVEGFFIIEGEGEPEEDMEGDEFDYLGEDNQIDLAPLICAAILMDVPQLPLCREDCAGICQDCGANLNEEHCNCAEARAAQAEADRLASNPFAVLSQLSFDDEQADCAIPEPPGAND